MNETSCDIHDVAHAASELVAVGCTIGVTHLVDGAARLRFSAAVAAYADEVIRAVDEGVIDAWQGVQELVTEYEDLASKARFYVQNGIGVAAGVMQVRTGVAVVAAPFGLGIAPGSFLIGHGANNIYEGLANVYNGPEAPATIGPVRHVYQSMLRNDHRGNVAYYSMDLLLSGYGMLKPVRKPDSFELFVRDPANYERAYQQAGKLALMLEVLVDFLTVDALHNEVTSG